MSDSELLAFVRAESHSFDEMIRRRDRREGFAAAFVFVAFGAQAVLASDWLVRAGAVGIMAASVFIWWTLRRARRPLDDEDAARSVTGELNRARDRVDTQIDLLESVLWWYVTPLATGGLLMTLGQGGPAWYMASMTVVWVLLSAGVWWLNQRAVREDLRPKRERLTRLIAQAEAP